MSYIKSKNNLSTLLFGREACKYTNIEYQWDIQPAPCLVKNLRYIGPVLASLTGRNSSDHVLCQVLSNLYQS